MKKPVALLFLLSLFIFSLPLSIGTNNAASLNKKTLVVFSTVSLPDSFNEFKKLKEDEGLNVILVKEDEIQGENKTAALRDYLKDNLESLNIKYLMIVGSDSSLPMMRFYPRGDGRSDKFDGYLEATPSDIFFSCLNEDFDKDRDGRYGEYPDDEIDINPDIFVGRIPIDDEDKLDKYFSSLVEFEKTPFNRKNRALLLGAYLAFNGEKWLGGSLKSEDGGEFMEKIINEILVKNRITPIRLYEDEGTLPSAFLHDFPLNTLNAQRLFKDETFLLVDINAHGSPYSIARYIWKDNDKDYVLDEGETTFNSLLSISNLPEKIKTGVVFAASCLTATPEAKDSLAKSFLERGACAYIGATRISWGPSYWKDVEDGGLLTINYLFVKNFIDKGESLGEAFMDAISEYHKTYFESDKEDPVDAAQMNTYTFNLFGDPTLKVNKTDDAPFMKRYSVYGFYGDTQFVPVEVEGEWEVSPFKKISDGFLVENIGEGRYEFSINDIPRSFHFDEIKNPVYIYPEKREYELYLHIIGKGEVVIHHSPSLRFKKCQSNNTKVYQDSYRNLLMVNGESVIVFSVLKDNYSISFNRGNIILFNPNDLDYNNDFVINEEDIFVFAHHFGLEEDESMYNSVFDLNLDGIIDGEDLIELSHNYGEIRR